MERYRKLEKIGEGTYGEVFKAQCKETGDFVALKRIKLGEEEDGIPPTALREISILMELNDIPNIVQYVKIPHPWRCCSVILVISLQLSFRLCALVSFRRLRDAIYSESQLYLVFEWLEKDLKKYMDAVSGSLEPKLVKVRCARVHHTNSWFSSSARPCNCCPPFHLQSYLYQLLKGIDACHRRGVMHRDLKPQNLLVDRTGTLKLADFGLARAFGLPVRRYTHEVC